MPIPGTASRSESVLGQELAILRKVRSPKMRKAGIFLRFASVNRQARNACSRRACRSGGAASPGEALANRPCAGEEDAANFPRFLLCLSDAEGAAASRITNR